MTVYTKAKWLRYVINQIMKDIMENKIRLRGTPTVLVEGIPGSGKTTALMYYATRYTSKCIVAFSRRRQRDWWFRNIEVATNMKFEREVNEDHHVYVDRFGVEHHIIRFKAKYEFRRCPLSEKEFETFLDYMLHCMLYQSTNRCPQPCPYRLQYNIIGNMLRSRHRVTVLATHIGGMVLDAVFEGAMHIIVDEFDEYALSISSLRVPIKKVEELKRLNDDIVRKLINEIETKWVRDDHNKVFYPPLLPINAKLAIVATATTVRDLVFLYRNVHVVRLYRIEPEYGENDVMFILDDARPNYVNTFFIDIHRDDVVDIVTESLSHSFNIGIIAPTKYVAKKLADILSSEGIDVFLEEPPKKSRKWVTIIVPGDTVYRSLSMEADVVIAFFQRWHIEKVMKTVHPWMYTALRPKHEFDTLDEFKHYRSPIGTLPLGDVEYTVIEMMYASNAQALFRFIRNHRKKHYVVILDKDMYHALEHFYRNTYLRHVDKYVMNNMYELANKFIEIVNRDRTKTR